MRLFQELKRRNVFRAAAAYAVAAWVIIEVSSLILEIYNSPDSVIRVIVALVALGFPFAVGFAWAFEVTPDGIKRESEVDHSQLSVRRSAKRWDILTVALIIVALGIFSIDRFGIDIPGSSSGTDDETASALTTDVNAAQQIIEIDRLRDLGKYGEAFLLARDVAASLGDDAPSDEFWTEYSWSTDIETDPPGARVLRQWINSDDSDWETLGLTPLQDVRFAEGEGYRLRFELEGHRTVGLLDVAIRGLEYRNVEPLRPVKLDPVDELPEGMVRIPGFTRDLVEYSDFFMNRFEVTNREFQEFAASGGYETEELWAEPFIRDGEELAWRDAVAGFVDKTGRPGPGDWAGGVYPDGLGDHPVTGISWYEAAAYANFVNSQLPTIAHHRAATFYYRDASWLVAPRSNLGGDGPRRVGENEAVNTLGVYDLVGNVSEWLSNQAEQGTRASMGAAWTDAPFHVGWVVPKSPWDREPTVGFRLIRNFDSEEKLARLEEPGVVYEFRDYSVETPASDAEFEIYRRMYAYDPQPLNAEVVEVVEFEHWNRERVDFDLPYGERGSAYLYIPKSGSAPFETVVLWSGSGILSQQSIEEEYVPAFDFIVRSGRVVVQPVIKGAFHRDDEEFSITHGRLLDDPGSATYRDFQIKWVQDVSRTIDYLETREDIESGGVGYYGFSFGALVAPIMQAIDERIEVSVLNVGGFWDWTFWMPEIDPFNFAPRVRTPVLMLNGEYDSVFPLISSQQPMFNSLGTAPENKKHVVTAGAHIVPRDVLIKETLDWFDRYLGSEN